MAQDLLDQEIATKEADVASGEAKIAECESQIQKLRQALDITGIELRMLKRAAVLRPAPGAQATATVVAPSAFSSNGAAAASTEESAAASLSGRFRDVVDQIRSGR